MSRSRIVLVRAPFVILYAFLLVLLLRASSLLRLLPVEVPPLGWVWVHATILVLLVPALLTQGSPLPFLLAPFVPLAVVSTYEGSHLDWLRVLKDFGVAHPGAPDAQRLALAGLALLVAWAAHAADLLVRWRTRARARGVPEAHARPGARAILRACLRHAAWALAGFAAIALMVSVLVGVQAGPVSTGRASLVAPLAAVGLVALAAAVLVRRPAERDASSDEA